MFTNIKRFSIAIATLSVALAVVPALTFGFLIDCPMAPSLAKPGTSQNLPNSPYKNTWQYYPNYDTSKNSDQSFWLTGIGAVKAAALDSDSKLQCSYRNNSKELSYIYSDFLKEEGKKAGFRTCVVNEKGTGFKCD